VYQHLPLIRVTHVTVEKNQLTELGAVENGHLLWRLSAAAVKSLYRHGLRLFLEAQGRSVEIYLSPVAPHSAEPDLRTASDTVSNRLLLSLPRFDALPL
jgi:hypothetical protein